VGAVTDGVATFGHWGRPVLVFPSEGGDPWEYERQGMTGAIGDLLAAGRVKLYCVGSGASEAWIVEHVVPFIHHDCGGAHDVIVTGCSLGALQAASVALSRADLFGLALCLSGVYDPLGWVSDLDGEHLQWLRDRLSVLLVCGQGQWEDTTGALDSTRRFAGLLHAKGLRCELDVWGYDVAHDWPWWRAQLAHHLPRFC
jgi:esterase/lipase superfamily enzyme